MEPLHEVIRVDMSSESCHCDGYWMNQIQTLIFW